MVDRVEPPEPGHAVTHPMNAVEAEIEHHTDPKSLRPKRPLIRPPLPGRPQGRQGSHDAMDSEKHHEVHHRVDCIANAVAVVLLPGCVKRQLPLQQGD